MARAFGAMLCLTLALAAITASVIEFVWYGPIYAQPMGAWRLFLLIGGCDFVLGPLLLLVVFNPKKTALARRTDVVVLGAVQLAAMLYGASVLWKSRPVFAVFAIDRITMVAASEVQTADLPLRRGDLVIERLPIDGPTPVTLVIPNDTAGHNAALDLELSGTPLHTVPRYYAARDPDRMRAAAKPLSTLLTARPEFRPALFAAAARARREASSLLYLPVETRLGFSTALLDPDDLGVIGFVDVDPF